jgi:hypothetical protein
MPSSDKHIKEGMAEYFTWLFVEDHKRQYLGLERTYDCMFKCLSPEYTCFKDWTRMYNKEIIKSSLLSVRRSGETRYENFLDLMKKLKALIR